MRPIGRYQHPKRPVRRDGRAYGFHWLNAWNTIAPTSWARRIQIGGARRNPQQGKTQVPRLGTESRASIARTLRYRHAGETISRARAI